MRQFTKPRPLPLVPGLNALRLRAEPVCAHGRAASRPRSDEQTFTQFEFPRRMDATQLPGAFGIIANGKKRQERPKGRSSTSSVRCCRPFDPDEAAKSRTVR